MVKAQLYVEGGSTKIQRTLCRKAFQVFFENAGLRGHLPRVFASGSRNSAYDAFCTALTDKKVDFAILLVDSEEAVAPNVTSRSYLRQAGWDKLTAAHDDQVHLMVQCMEAWFLADLKSLENYFGRNFSANALPKESNVEAIPKDDLLDGIVSATRKTRSNNAYSKGNDTFKILEMLNPKLVCKASLRAKHLIDVLHEKLVAPESVSTARTTAISFVWASISIASI